VLLEDEPEVVRLHATAITVVIHLDVVATRRENPDAYVLIGIPGLSGVADDREVGGIIIAQDQIVVLANGDVAQPKLDTAWGV
jgi:hypothetical protein